MLEEYIQNKTNEALELMQNDSEEALIIFNEILEIEPENIAALNGKGSTLMKLDKFEEAETYFDESLSIKENSSALINKGIILKNKKEYEKALEYYEKAIHVNAKMKNIVKILKNEIFEILNDDSQMELNNYTDEANENIKNGLACKNAGKLWDALDFYKKAMSNDSNCREYVNILITDIKITLQKEFLFSTPKFGNTKIDALKIQSLRALLIEENPQKALKLTDLILELDEKDIDTLNQKGYILFIFDEYDKSLPYFDKCLAIDNSYYYALFNKAIVLRMIGNLEDALDCFDELLKMPEYKAKVKPYQLEILDKLHEKQINTD
jgi:tetratricopeptide (TPR) repeat protein